MVVAKDKKKNGEPVLQRQLAPIKDPYKVVFHCPVELHEWFRQYCFDHKVSMNLIFNLALEHERRRYIRKGKRDAREEQALRASDGSLYYVQEADVAGEPE